MGDTRPANDQVHPYPCIITFAKAAEARGGRRPWRRLATKPPGNRANSKRIRAFVTGPNELPHPTRARCESLRMARAAQKVRLSYGPPALKTPCVLGTGSTYTAGSPEFRNNPDALHTSKSVEPCMVYWASIPPLTVKLTGGKPARGAKTGVAASDSTTIPPLPNSFCSSLHLEF